MILKELSVYSLVKGKKMKEYPINDVGLSIVLASKKDSITEGNGSGKTTFIECINTLLGKEIPNKFSTSKELIEKDIFLVLLILFENKKIFLGRRIIEKDKGYILKGEKFTLELDKWEDVEDASYKSRIQEYNYGSFNNNIVPSFSTVREYLIRDEKKGFGDIFLDKRNAVSNHKIISFLSELPFELEKEILPYKKRITELNQKKKFIDSISGEIKELKIKHKKITAEVLSLQNIIDNSNLNGKIEVDRKKYSETKRNLNEIQRKIFKLEKVQEQYSKNISNLQDKIDDIKKLNDIKEFYDRLINYFPNSLTKNYVEIKEFYDFMLNNRGNYFEDKINEIQSELEELYSKRKMCEKDIENSSKILRENDIVEDINLIIEELNSKNLLLAEINVKINSYEQKKVIQKEINKEKAKILKKVEEAQIKFEECSTMEEKLSEVFDELLDVTYKEKGDLEFELVESIDQNKSTGRIKVNCKIEDEDSHGRSYMKVNIFDLTLLLNRIKSDFILQYLIHDGSYCKPDDLFAKGRLIRYIDKELLELKKGQYIITANIDEFNEEEIKWFIDNKKIIANLSREENNNNRFFGFKY